jgi:hypothetical protein
MRVKPILTENAVKKAAFFTKLLKNEQKSRKIRIFIKIAIFLSKRAFLRKDLLDPKIRKLSNSNHL